MRVKRKRLLVAAALSGLCLLAPTAASASQPVPNDDATSEAAGASTVSDLKTALPPVPADLMTWAASAQDELISSDQFSTIRISDDRASAEVYWHGDTAPALTEALAEAPTAYPVDVVGTEFLPGLLRDTATELINAGSLAGQTVTSTAARADGSGIDVTVEASARPNARYAPPTEVDGIPVNVTVGAADPAVGRQDDSNHIGGSRLVNQATFGECTLGFAVRNSAGANAGIFASHCGNVGNKWLRPSPNGYVNMGTVASEVNNRDGAILTNTFFNPGVYIGSYTSDAFVTITGSANPVINTEICYSGSYSGTSCGNLVVQPLVNYSLTGVGTIIGHRTMNAQGLPAVGNGDSGGPGIIPVAAPGGGVYLWASSIISAIPTQNKSANCQGVPGEGPPNSTQAFRQCSPEAFATSARDIAGSGGYSIWTVAP